jgi:hypothetical protein
MNEVEPASFKQYCMYKFRTFIRVFEFYGGFTIRFRCNTSKMVLETGNDYCATLRLFSIVCICADEFLNKQGR